MHWTHTWVVDFPSTYRGRWHFVTALSQSQFHNCHRVIYFRRQLTGMSHWIVANATFSRHVRCGIRWCRSRTMCVHVRAILSFCSNPADSNHALLCALIWHGSVTIRSVVNSSKGRNLCERGGQACLYAYLVNERNPSVATLSTHILCKEHSHTRLEKYVKSKFTGSGIEPFRFSDNCFKSLRYSSSTTHLMLQFNTIIRDFRAVGI